jgi:hypothetical protein
VFPAARKSNSSFAASKTMLPAVGRGTSNTTAAGNTSSSKEVTTEAVADTVRKNPQQTLRKNM